jgi:hypothetical protein
MSLKAWAYAITSGRRGLRVAGDAAARRRLIAVSSARALSSVAPGRAAQTR